MARTPASDANRSVRLAVRTTEAERDEIDKLRGAASVSDYLRGLVRQDARRRRASTGG